MGRRSVGYGCPIIDLGELANAWYATSITINYEELGPRLERGAPEHHNGSAPALTGVAGTDPCVKESGKRAGRKSKTD